MTDREPWTPPAITTVEKPGADPPLPPEPEPEEDK